MKRLALLCDSHLPVLELYGGSKKRFFIRFFFARGAHCSPVLELAARAQETAYESAKAVLALTRSLVSLEIDLPLELGLSERELPEILKYVTALARALGGRYGR